MADATLIAKKKKCKRRIRPCSIEGCNSLVVARMLCKQHYQQFRASPDFAFVPRNTGTPEERFHNSYRVDEASGCWVWSGWCNDKGYAMLDLPGNRKVRASRFSYELKCGPIPEGMKVLHTCDRPICVNPSHLFLGTSSDNTRDMYAKGRGRTEWSHKLDPAKAETMRRLHAEGGYSVTALARLFSVSSDTVRRVLRGQSWAP